MGLSRAGTQRLSAGLVAALELTVASAPAGVVAPEAGRGGHAHQSMAKACEPEPVLDPSRVSQGRGSTGPMDVAVDVPVDDAVGYSELGQEALELLRQLTGDPASEFRPDQLDVIRRLVGERQRVLLVQRTGWGKSAVYFIATRLLRDRGGGPTLLVSPLLALMRNQIEAAERMGVRAVTINSANRGGLGRRSPAGSTTAPSTSCSSRPSGSPTRSSAPTCCPRSAGAAGCS